jgi:hypothetical protein
MVNGRMSPPEPFATVRGRDTTKDEPGRFDIARWYYDARSHVAADAAILRQLIAAVDWTNDLSPSQWAQWYSVALAFRPDLILELGRGRGNSTAVFCQAAAALGHTSIVSLCHSGDWTTVTAPRLAEVVAPQWFEPLDARMTDIVTADYADILGDHRRILLLWDAHGFEIAEVVLGEILPRLVDREHLVIMHDIVDNRYAGVSRSYGGQPLWKGSEWQQRTGCVDARVNIGWMQSIQDQIVAIADFSARNDLEIGSADHEYHRLFDEGPGPADEMRAVLGEEFFSAVGHWAFFSLTGKAGPFEFPAVTGRRSFSHEGGTAVDGIPDLPVTVVTAAQVWAFASAWTWRPTVEPPAGADAWLRVRLQVDGGSVGIGLLAGNGTDFLVRRALSPHRATAEVLLPVADVTNPGKLVVHTWAAPVSARVRIEDLTLVW